MWKTLVVAGVAIATNVMGNYALGRGMHALGALTVWSPLPYVRAFAQPWVAAGVLFTLGWALSRLALLSWADLSYVLPVTSLSYVLSAFVGEAYLDERVSLAHWAGITAITLGATLVALTYPESTDVPEEAA